jgi:multiple antibiotic resistance protein
MILPNSTGFFETLNFAFLLAFPSLFAIINPIGAALIFDGIAKDFSGPERSNVTARVSVYSLLVILGALWGGAYVLGFFGVSLTALRVAGGVVVALNAWRLLTEEDRRVERESRRKPVASGEPHVDPLQLAFFPLTLPFTTGPGTIAVAIALGSEHPSNGTGLVAFFIGGSLAAALNASIIWIAYRFSDRVTGSVAPEARLVIARLSAFLLMCIGVEILIGAADDLVRGWR